VASAVLAYGALAGRGPSGRAAERPSAAAFEAGERLRSLATELDTTPARLAIAFALSNPEVTSVLFGASRPEQVVDNVGSVEVLARLGEGVLAELRRIGA
jgi:aryl-alcohol dehydrogenase-like predicted oxidoreductase